MRKDTYIAKVLTVEDIAKDAQKHALAMHANHHVAIVTCEHNKVRLANGILLVSEFAPGVVLYRVEYDDGTAIDFAPDDVGGIMFLHNILLIYLTGGKDLLKEF